MIKLLGLAVLIVLLAAYLSDCIPGLGSGGEPAPPASEPSEAPPSKAEPSEGASSEAASSDTLVLTVQGDRCRRGQAPATACPAVCAALPRDRVATVTVEVEAATGHHGTVEALRECLRLAGFANVRVRSE